MLSSIYIKNLAIINELKVSFVNGLNIITGETGAGKSLIIKAVQLLMGEKFSPEVLRTGSDTLVVEGVFLRGSLQTVIRRIYRKNGRSKSFINNEPVKQKELFKTTRLIADLHGQHDHQNLLNSITHLNYLDSFGSYNAELIDINKLFHKTEKCKILLNKRIAQHREIKTKKELHEFQLKEMTLHPISVQFEKEVTKKHSLLSKASDIQESLAQVDNILANEESAVIKKINIIINELYKVSEYDESIHDIQKRMESNRIDLEDLLLDIQIARNNIVYNIDELEKVDEIISHIEMLKRKYGGSINSIVEYKDKLMQDELEYDGCREEITKLKEELINYQADLLKSSRVISRKRIKTAKQLENTIKQNLRHLNMPETQFKIQLLSNTDHISETGIDICEFFISANVGEELRPVVKIASGGEISRIMLAVKMALQSKDIVNTLIFDEIDLGISGVTAERVGETLEKLAVSHQILCITHLSQIAGKGDSHYKVSKDIKHGRISVKVNKLSKSDRVGEIAILISGRNVTESGRKQAQELLHG